MELRRSVSVSLPCVNEPIPLSVGDKVIIPIDVWEYTAKTINNVERKPVWLSHDNPTAITGVVRWLGTLPLVGGTQLFAGIQTVSFLYLSVENFKAVYITVRKYISSSSFPSNYTRSLPSQNLCSKLFIRVARAPHPF